MFSGGGNNGEDDKIEDPQTMINNAKLEDLRAWVDHALLDGPNSDRTWMAQAIKLLFEQNEEFDKLLPLSLKIDTPGEYRFGTQKIYDIVADKTKRIFYVTRVR